MPDVESRAGAAAAVASGGPAAPGAGSTAEPSEVSARARILVVAASAETRGPRRQALLAAGHLVDATDEVGVAAELLGRRPYDLLLTDLSLRRAAGLKLMILCKETQPEIEVILIGEAADRDAPCGGAQSGAYDWIETPVSVTVLLDRVQAGLARRRERQEGFERTLATEADNQGGFRILRTLGAGSMGVVLLVERQGTLYAMKLLRCRGAFPNEPVMTRFFREARILSRIDHPGVVRIVDYGLDTVQHLPFILMEYVRGQSLTSYVTEGILAIQQKLSILRQIAAALDVVHRHGILHRDVKPSNVLVTEGTEVKLVDFGIARLLDSGLVAPREVLGSPAYMAPESFESVRALDQRTDLFSLGVLGYEVIAGSRPFQGETIGELVYAVQRLPPRTPCHRIPGLPAGVPEVMTRLLEKDPAKRFQTAGEVVEALDAVGV